MNPRDSIRTDHGASLITNRYEIISRYKHLRMVSVALNYKMSSRLSKEDRLEGGRKLGMLYKGGLWLDSEDQISVLIDYCLFDLRREGRNAIEQYLIDSPPDPDSDEMTCLQAMRHAKYSVFIVESAERGLGVTVTDLLSREHMLVVDLGFGSTAKPGLLFASRLLFHDGFAMMTGASLAVGMLPPEHRDAMANKLLRAAGPDIHFDPAPVIRGCLRGGSSSQVKYLEPGKFIGLDQVASRGRPAKVSGNAFCPCGSGKKYKHCCMNFV